MDPSKQPGVIVGQIIVKRVVFEHRADYLSLPHTTPMPELEISVNARAGIANDGKSGLIQLTVQTNPAQNPYYVLDITIESLVQIVPGQENMTIQEYVTTSGVALLYPFARELVANLTSRGRFGPIWLKPFNVAAAVAAAPPRPAARPAVRAGQG